MILEIISYIALVTILGSYYYMNKTGNIDQYNTVNFIGAFPLTTISLMAGVYPTAMLSAAYGLIAGWKIISRFIELGREDELADSSVR